MKKRKRKQFPVILAVIPAAVLVAAGIAFLNSRSTSEEEYCKKNATLLASLEKADISATEQQLQELKAMESGDVSDAEANDLNEDEGTFSIEPLDTIRLKQIYQGSVIVGDSITESIVEYGYLDTDVVIGQLGLRIDDADEQLAAAISLKPQNLFLAFGTNDLELYEGNAQGFADAYRKQLEMLQSALPDTAIYINSILPVQQSAIDETPSLGYYPEFNQALEDLCQQMGCTFIDNTFLVDGRDDMYEPDGEHVIADYYPLWLTYMAETAGLV